MSKDAFNVGDRVTLTCTVTAGDEPMTLKWLKDGQEVSPRSVSVSVLSAFTSVLMVESLTQEHHGNYTCEASNEAASATETAQLVVNGNSARGTSGLPSERFLSLCSFISGNRFPCSITCVKFILFFFFLLIQFLLLLSPFPSKTGCLKACARARCVA